MKKIKLLAPVLGATAIAGMVTPIVTSCNKDTKQEYRITFSSKCAYAFDTNVSRIKKGHDLWATISCTQFCIIEGSELQGEIRCGRKVLQYDVDYTYYMSGEESSSFNLVIKAASITDDIVIDVQNIKNIVPILINGEIDRRYEYNLEVDGESARYFDPSKLVGDTTHTIRVTCNRGYAIPNDFHYGNVQYKWNSDQAEVPALEPGEWEYEKTTLPTWRVTTIKFHLQQVVQGSAINISVIHRNQDPEFEVTKLTGFWIDETEQRHDIPEGGIGITAGSGEITYFGHEIQIKLNPSALPAEVQSYRLSATNILIHFDKLGEAVSTTQYNVTVDAEGLNATITFTEEFYVHLMQHPSDAIVVDAQIVLPPPPP